MADLYWNRLMAGTYETQFFANGYKYRIEKDESYNTWRIWYMWDKSTDKKWKRIRNFYSSDTLKDSKRYCQQHNDRPRAKWKLVEKEVDGKNAGQYKWQELDRDGEPYRYRAYYMQPEDLFTIIDDDERKGEIA